MCTIPEEFGIYGWVIRSFYKLLTVFYDPHMCIFLSYHSNSISWYDVKGPNKSEWYKNLYMCMYMIRFMLHLSHAIIVMDFSQWKIPPCIYWMIWMPYHKNKLNKSRFQLHIVCAFFGNIPSLHYSKYCFCRWNLVSSNPLWE